MDREVRAPVYLPHIMPLGQICNEEKVIDLAVLLDKCSIVRCYWTSAELSSAVAYIQLFRRVLSSKTQLSVTKQVVGRNCSVVRTLLPSHYSQPSLCALT